MAKSLVDVFSPETYQIYSTTDMTVSGFRTRHRQAAERVSRGDHLLCYVTKLSRWVGVLEALDGPFDDSTPIYTDKDDPFTVRFKVKPLVWLKPQYGVPTQHEDLWNQLSFTRDLERGSSSWTGQVRTCLAPINGDDAATLLKILQRQAHSPKEYPLTEVDRRHLNIQVVQGTNGPVPVKVPDDSIEEEPPAHASVRESIKPQARLAQLGSQMGMRIWLPPSDRSRVLELWKDDQHALFDQLPLNYDVTTLETIRNIDVIWMKQRAIVRAFEVEHTTAIYSGILRMADLLALQPNMDIRLHIVAPESRRDRVFDQLRRPVFSLLERRPLCKTCSFLSYEDLDELFNLPHLKHLSDSVIDEYADLTDGVA